MPHLRLPHDPKVNLYYEDLGEGDPVVLIHGWPLSGRAWEAQLGPLVSNGHRVITYDRRGFGESSQPWHGYDYETFAADLDALMSDLDLRDATLVGFSMGGGEVVRYLSKYGSDRVAQAVLASAVPPYLYKSTDNPDGGLDDATIDGMLEGIDADRPKFLRSFVKDFFSGSGLGNDASTEMREYSEQIARLASVKGTRDCVVAFSQTDFRDDLTRLTVPTLVIHGDADKTVPFEVSGKRAAESISGAELVVLKGAPHGCNVTHAEEFNAALLSFLARKPARAGAAAAR